MPKLKLESLQVESFATTHSALGVRGTVAGRAEAAPGTTIIGPGTGVSECMVCVPLSQYNCESINICKDTEYLDCTYGCTRNTCDPRINSCGDVCWIDDSAVKCQVG
ncbi:hypothetical protein [Longimicrobium sp.]|uniref:hypothetical protein n=1 Tax=Longimicrobium sp. TaxID=2029185 RepID=UPI002BD34F94|nr:hypothetical protein [Longimicrobium sp.]HSU14879.1 hypothetical protein [Longimicrobium sp.]